MTNNNDSGSSGDWASVDGVTPVMVPVDETRLPVPDRKNPATPLAQLMDGNERRPPWDWANLTGPEAEQLDRMLDGFVYDHNQRWAAASDMVIPGCWRRHPPLVHELPVMFWSWWASHRASSATIVAASEFYTRTLPAFHTRLPVLLGPGAATCRNGRHSLSPEVPQTIADSTDRAGEHRVDPLEFRPVTFNG